MFRSKPSYRKCFGVNHQAEKVSDSIQKFLEGAGKFLGPFRIFRTAPGECSRRGDSTPLFMGGCFVWCPLWGGSPFLVGGCWGVPMVGGSPHIWWEHVRRGGRPLGAAPLVRPWLGGPWGHPSPFGGLMLGREGPVILGSHLLPLSPAHYPINRAGEELSNTSKISHIKVCNDLPFSLSPSTK
jgi:hypothetical protein